MALKKLRMICAGGDKLLAEWDTETVSPQRLSELSRARLKMGPPAGDRVVVLADRTARTATLLAAQ